MRFTSHLLRISSKLEALRNTGFSFFGEFASAIKKFDEGSDVESIVPVSLFDDLGERGGDAAWDAAELCAASVSNLKTLPLLILFSFFGAERENR